MDERNWNCAVDGCERQVFARGWCRGHYNRVKRTGSLGTEPIQDRRIGCIVEGCESKHSGRGYCKTHLYRVRTNGDPEATRLPNRPAGPDNPTWIGDAVGYQSLHARLRRHRGKASQYTCDICGDAASAWAYQHTDPDERMDDKTGLPFTTDLSHYEPMCTSCHVKLDAQHGEQRTSPWFGTSLDKRRNRWRAYASVDGRQYSAGSYPARADAAAAALALRLALARGEVLPV